jgi:hypothetical protein
MDKLADFGRMVIRSDKEVPVVVFSWSLDDADGPFFLEGFVFFGVRVETP